MNSAIERLTQLHTFTIIFANNLQKTSSCYY